MIDPSLTGGGDCFSHYHSEDRKPTQDLLHGLQGQAKVVMCSESCEASLAHDFYLVDTTSGVVNITLPMAKNNRLVTFVRIDGGNLVNLNASSPDTVNGGASVSIISSYSPTQLLAVTGLGYVQV